MAATSFGDWIRSQGNALLFDNDLANLAAQQHEALNGAPSLYAEDDDDRRAAIKAAEEFQEKYQ